MARAVLSLLLSWMLAALLACSSADSDTAEATGSGPGATSGHGASGATGAGASAATSSGAGATGTGGTGTGGNTAEVLVAFIGDSGNGSEFKQVLDLVMNEKVDAVVHNGDYDYGLDPDAFFATVDGKVGASFPYFASVGNHDAGAWSDYAAYLKTHMDAVGVTLDDPDMMDQKFSFHWRGLHNVFVGENGNNSEFAQFIDDQFSANETDWKICGWHKNQAAMQIGGKGDEMGWDVYENCRKHGAIITTGHEHSYERTKTMTSATNQEVDTTCSDPKAECVSPGRTFVIVSGLAGVGIRDQERCLPTTAPYGCKGEWASVYTSDQGAKYGALFIVFNVGGDPLKAHGYFKNVDAEVIDQFDITRSP